MKRITVLSTLLVLAVSAHAGLYRWVDEAGNVHFSDKVPVAASKKAHSKLNKDGIVKKTVDPESIQSEKDHLALIEKEREKQEYLRELERKAIAKVQRRNDYLLSTYENKEELIRSFESKIKMIEGNSKILTAQNKVLNKRIDKLKTHKPATEVKAKSVENKIVNLNLTIKQYEKALLENEQQIEKLTHDYAADLKLYTELTK